MNDIIDGRHDSAGTFGRRKGFVLDRQGFGEEVHFLKLKFYIEGRGGAAV